MLLLYGLALGFLHLVLEASLQGYYKLASSPNSLEIGQKSTNINNSGHLALDKSTKGLSEKLILFADNVQEGLSLYRLAVSKGKLMSYNVIKAAGSSMRNIQQAIDVVSHNIANVNTTAYKAKSVNFESVVTNFGESTFSGTAVNSINSNFNQGRLQNTSLWTDMAIQGKGFFTVQNATGEIVYSRDGHFVVDHNSNLVTTDGNFVLSSGGGRITIPAEAETVEVTPGGEIMVKLPGALNATLQDQVQVATFVNTQNLESIGNNFYRESLNSGPPQYSTALGVGTATAETKIISGALERANADLAGSFTDLIAYQRSFQAVSRSASTADDVLQSTLGLIT